jgi:hypothetical protein
MPVNDKPCRRAETGSIVTFPNKVQTMGRLGGIASAKRSPSHRAMV